MDRTKNMITEVVDEVVTTQRAADLLGCTRATIRHMLKARELPGIKKGSEWHIPLGAVTEASRVCAMQAPSHPGLIIRDDVLPALELSVHEAAHQMNICPTLLKRVVNARERISEEIAAWVARCQGGEPGMWLRMQQIHDQWKRLRAARQRHAPASQKQKEAAA